MALDKYQKKDLHTHIYDTPDTYVGGTDEIEDLLPIYLDGKIVNKSIKYIPALYNIFNEILVNARDQIIRLQQSKSKNPVTKIEIEYDKDTKMWSIYNDGEGIDIADHPTERDSKGKKINIVEMIFGHLLTSKNYDKDEKKIVGGKNGYGAKLTNIFSTYFKIETVDSKRKLKYVQEFTNNMRNKTKAKKTEYKSKSYTRISWIADFKRFGKTKYSKDMLSLMVRRIYDLSGTTDKSINVSFNKQKISVKSFDKYISMINDKNVYESINERWQIGISTSSDKFEHFSFVNGIATPKGGKHVDYISKQIISKLSAHIKKKNRVEIPEPYIKNYLHVFINSVIENPSFDSQTKERLITTQSKFGSTAIISDKFIKQIADKLDIVSKVISFTEFKLNKEVKKTDGAKVTKLRNIAKLDDANFAGTKRSNECTLILTEGDSAKSMVISGLSVIGRDKYGVFPLKGKILNVRDASHEQIMKNTELINIKKILGLSTDKVYKNTNTLRYGKVLILTDQDHDGSHIKGLFINFIHSACPSLLKIGYIQSMITPIVKTVKGNNTNTFYNLTDYNEWKEKTNTNGWKTKYYKGLGTSTAIEAREYFKDMKMNNYLWTDDTDDKMDLAFKKDLADNRKDWLYNYDSNNIIEGDETEIPIDRFIDNELIHFSNSDTLRSIGSVCDGLKPSQRKILYCAFKRKLYSEIRVAQLAGYVSENAAYHHGEASLHGTIINLAQDYVGSNNINLLKPNGQFGTRILGGSDAASPRYIHTELNPIVKYIYPESDFPLLNYIDDDGLSVEPTYYIPIIPMVLVNGMIGIGTGFSTKIPQYDPLDIIRNIVHKIDNEPYDELIPWYKGFTGTILKEKDKTYISKGSYNIISKDTIVITELPIGTWTQSYKTFLESLIEDDTKNQKTFIHDFTDNSTDDTVHFTIRCRPETIKALTSDKNIDSIESMFKLTSKINLTNLHLYDTTGKIKRYDNIDEIMDDYYGARLDLYIRRKKHQLKKLKNELDLNISKMKFIKDVMDEKIVIYKNTKKNIIEELIKLEYKKIDGSFNYLINMPLYNFTIEKIQELSIVIDVLVNEYETLDKLSEREIWKKELKELVKYMKK